MKRFIAAILFLALTGAAFAQSTGNSSMTVTNTNQNGQSTSANSSPVVLSSNQYPDPCVLGTGISAPISLSAATSAIIITHSGTKSTYICHLDIVVSGADNVALIEGNTSLCGTGTYGLAGGITAATGWNFAANSGIAIGNGAGTVISADHAAGDDVCLLPSSTAQISGSVRYVQQ
jgi:hypothetical protein